MAKGWWIKLCTLNKEIPCHVVFEITRVHIANAALFEEWVVPETEVSILVTRGGDIFFSWDFESCWGATQDGPLKKRLENWWQENCSEISSIKNSVSALTITSQKQRETKPVWFSTLLLCHSFTHLKESKFYKICSIQCIMNYCLLWGLKLVFFLHCYSACFDRSFRLGCLLLVKGLKEGKVFNAIGWQCFPVTGGTLECFCQAKGCVHLPEKFLMRKFQDKAKCELHWKSSF